MALLSDEDVARVVVALEARGYTVRREQGGGVAGDVGAGGSAARVLLEEKHFRRIDKFVGEAAKWQEWLFSLCVAVGTVNASCTLAMEEVVRVASSITDVSKIEATVSEDIRKKFGTELFSVLCSLTGGEANVVVRGVVQKGAGYCGFAALCALSQRFNPKTPARVLQFLATVLSPQPVKDVRHLERAVEEWEVKLGKLRNEYEEDFSDTVKVAIITGMVPRDLQDMVFQMGKTGERLLYKEVRDKIMSIASHRAQMAMPVPMDIGWAGGSDPEGAANPDVSYFGETYFESEIDAVAAARANSHCYRCGGWGHFARECGTPEGKGPKGKGKAGQKGGGKEGAKAQGKGVPGNQITSKGFGKKGGGKGYQGTCWTCGKVGHKSNECNTTQVNGIDAEDDEPQNATSVGGVWTISQVSNLSVPSVCMAKTRVKLATETGGRDMFVKVGRCNGAQRPRSCQGGDWADITTSKTGRRLIFTPRSRAEQAVSPLTSNRFSALADEEKDELDICATQEVGDVCGVRTDITVDSAADESVCPREWAQQFGTAPSLKHLKLVNASGGPIAHYGSRHVAFRPDEASRVLGVGFEVTDVKKPLLSVKRICERGNTVHFGPSEGDNYIQNVANGEKLQLQRKGNSYVLRGSLVPQDPF